MKYVKLLKTSQTFFVGEFTTGTNGQLILVILQTQSC